MIRQHKVLLITSLWLASSCSDPERAPRAGESDTDQDATTDGGTLINEDEIVLEAIESTMDYKQSLMLLDDVHETLETHADAASVRVWVSTDIVDLFLSIDPDDPTQAISFPEGTVLLKEHFGPADEYLGFNVMYKGPPGYDPQGGDWIWGEVRGDQEIVSQGRIETCRECHAAAINSDFAVGFGKSQ